MARDCAGNGAGGKVPASTFPKSRNEMRCYRSFRSMSTRHCAQHSSISVAPVP